MCGRQSLIRSMAKMLLVLLGGCSLLFAVSPTHGAGEDYPARTITLYVGFPPGAAAAVGAQIFAEGAKKYLPKPQPIILDHKSGASGAIAADYVLKQPSDGYSLLWIASDLIIKLAKDGPQLHFTKEDFIPIGAIATTPGILTVNNDSAFKQLEDFIDYAKKNPGKLSFSSAGIAGSIHLNTEIFMLRTGIKMNHIPFGGGAQAATALLGGHVDCQVGSMMSVGPHILGGGLRALAVLARERLPELPNVPTCLEKGYDIDRGFWHYLAMAKGTPPPTLDVMQNVFYKTADDPQVKAALTRAGYRPMRLGAEETTKKVKEEFDLAKEVFTKLGLK